MKELPGLTRNLITQKDVSLDKIRNTARRWEQITSTLGTSSDKNKESFDSDNPLKHLTEVIAGIGITLHIQGEFPQKGHIAYLLTSAVKECAVNTVRHAKENEITVDIIKRGYVLTASITNNGKRPESNIIEGGGLSALRHRIESVGGTMKAEPFPQFKLIITLPMKEKM